MLLQRNILKYYSPVTLYANVMFVNRVALLITVSRDIYYGTMKGLIAIKIPVLEMTIKNFVKLYAVRGFVYIFILVYIQFKTIKDHNNIDGVNINVVSRDEHVEEIERYICLIKKCAQCCWVIMPFEKIPKRIMCILC